MQFTLRLKHVIFILTIFLGHNSQSQSDKVFFSKSGDTVLYSFGGTVTSMHMDTTDWNIMVSSFTKKHERLDTVSNFTIRTNRQGEKPFPKLSKDSISKYNLEYDGLPVGMEDIQTFCKTSHVKMLSTSNDKKKYLYKARLSIQVRYKSKVVGNLQTYIMFKGKNKADIDFDNICYTYVWKKENKDKFFIHFRIKSFGCADYNFNYNDCSSYDKYIVTLY